MLTTIRKLAYKRGLRPKGSSILYSPTLHIHHAFKDLTKQFHNEQQEVNVETERLELYHLMKYCILCGHPLVELGKIGFEVRMKECPRDCGSACADLNTDGIPFIAFDR